MVCRSNEPREAIPFSFLENQITDPIRNAVEMGFSGTNGDPAFSDLIAKLSGKAYWRKLFVRTDVASVEEARRICGDIIATGGQPRLF